MTSNYKLISNSKKKAQLSVVIPVLNEADNIESLIMRLSKTLKNTSLTYEIIFVNDHSVDNTVKEIKKIVDNYSIILQTNTGPKGKSTSLLQGFQIARYDFIAMIDADLQYPPEAIPSMLSQLTTQGADLVIANRKYYDISIIRSVGSYINKFINKRILGYDFDVQSGLKLFRKSILRGMQFDNVGPWTLDLALIDQAVSNNYCIKSVDIKFSPRINGVSKINFSKVSFDIFREVILIKIKRIKFIIANILSHSTTKQFISFSLIGLLNTFIDVSIYLLLIHFINFFTIHYVFAKVISYSLAVVNSFVLNSNFTFKGNNKSLKSIFPFYATSLVGLVLNSSMIYLAYSFAHLSQLVSLALATLVVFIWNFLISKFYIFSK